MLDSAVWAADELLPHLTVRRRAASAVVHPTCAMRHLDDQDRLPLIAAACVEDVVVPDDAGCRAFAGAAGCCTRS